MRYNGFSLCERGKYFKRKGENMKKMKCVVAKEGRVLMANDRVARKFISKTSARRFVGNLVQKSTRLRVKDFEMITI